MKFLKVSSLILLLCGLLAFRMAGIEFDTKALLGNKIELKIPKGFVIMSDDMAKLKYPPARRPTLIYTNETGAISVALNLTSDRATQAQLPAIKENLMHTYRHQYMGAREKWDDMKVINGRNVCFIEFSTPGAETSMYKMLFFTDVRGQLLLCTVDCTEKNIEQWKLAAKEMMASLKVK